MVVDVAPTTQETLQPNLSELVQSVLMRTGLRASPMLDDDFCDWMLLPGFGRAVPEKQLSWRLCAGCAKLRISFWTDCSTSFNKPSAHARISVGNHDTLE